ncbi:MAG: hypothetical protein U1A78_27905 [Polyangia bacterium]
MKETSKRLVIDASLARAAGPLDAPHPLARQCRQFLQDVLSICHRIVWTPEIKDEWDKHQSRHARAWLVAMRSRRKVVSIEVPADQTLCDGLKQAAGSERASRDMLKDSHLLEAALAADQIVVSLDETVHADFAAAAAGLQAIQSIVWVNPGQSPDALRDWLVRGALRTATNTLGARRSRPEPVATKRARGARPRQRVPK